MPRINPVLLFLTCTSAVALYRARGQLWAAGFVVSAYVNLLALLSCLRLLEMAPPGDLRRRRRLKLAVLVLATTLNATFCYQVSKWMPPAVSVVLWLLTALVSAGALLLFYHDDGRPRPGGRTNNARRFEERKIYFFALLAALALYLSVSWL